MGMGLGIGEAMDDRMGLGSWRRWWSFSAGLYFAVLALLILAVFPSRADYWRGWRMQSLDIERQFDLGLHGIRRDLIQKRYAGLSDSDTVKLVREKFERMYPASRQLDSGDQVLSRYIGTADTMGASPQRVPGSEAADLLVWRDNDGTRLTREAAGRLREDLAQIDARYGEKLSALPWQKARVLALGLALGALALGLLYSLGLCAERWLRARPVAHASPAPAISSWDFSELWAGLLPRLHR